MIVALLLTLSLACSAVSFAFMVQALVSTRRRARVHDVRMRARLEAGVAQVDQADASYRDRNTTTMRSVRLCLACAVVAMLLLGIAAVV